MPVQESTRAALEIIARTHARQQVMSLLARLSLISACSAFRVPSAALAARPASRTRTLMCSADTSSLEERIKSDIAKSPVVFYSKTT